MSCIQYNALLSYCFVTEQHLALSASNDDTQKSVVKIKEKTKRYKLISTKINIYSHLPIHPLTHYTAHIRNTYAWYMLLWVFHMEISISISYQLRISAFCEWDNEVLPFRIRHKWKCISFLFVVLPLPLFLVNLLNLVASSYFAYSYVFMDPSTFLYRFFHQLSLCVLFFSFNMLTQKTFFQTANAKFVEKQLLIERISQHIVNIICVCRKSTNFYFK